MKTLMFRFLLFAVTCGFVTGGTFTACCEETEPIDEIKFLVISERKKIEDALTSETGNFLEFNSILGWKRFSTIEQCDSLESLYTHFEEDPAYPYVNFEVYPLVEMDLTQ